MTKRLTIVPLMVIMLLSKLDIEKLFRNFFVKRISANTKIKLPIWFGKPRPKNWMRFVKLNFMVKCLENDVRKLLQSLVVLRLQKRCLSINHYKLGIQGLVPLSNELVVNIQNVMLFTSLTLNILRNDFVYD